MKKILTTILLCLAAFLGVKGQTPVDATIDSASIQYWVGTGNNYAILIVNWAEPDTALAWGFRFNGTSTTRTMLDSISANDSRFWYTGTAYMEDIYYISGQDTMHISAWSEGFNMWWGNINGACDYGGFSCTLNNGDVYKYGETKCGVGYDLMDEYYLNYAWIKAVTPVTIPTSSSTPTDATISENDILYWVGIGEKSVILAVNWADTALAWGYHFNGTSTTLQTVMDDIAAADPRFSYSGTGYINDINFVVDSADTLGITTGNYWNSLTNGVLNSGIGSTLVDGDLAKWGDPACGTIVDSTYWNDYNYWSYTYVWEMGIHPVSIPDSNGSGDNPEPEHGPFCGAVGTEGCEAIQNTSEKFVAWATGCTVTRGPDNISNPDSPLATYGNDMMAIGPVNGNNQYVVSLGDGGNAVLTFANPIKNGEGFDFAVFENSFNDSFLELAFVEVSSNGTDYVRFPATSLTPTDVQVGPNGPVDPTYIDNLAGKYRNAWGTPFDLDDIADSTGIDINNITHVRIIDVVGSINPEYATYDAFGHIVNDPFPTPTGSYGSSGFDLAGVGVINQNSNDIEGIEDISFAIYPNPAHDYVQITMNHKQSDVQIFDITGRIVKSIKVNGSATISLHNLKEGVYILKAGTMTQKLVIK